MKKKEQSAEELLLFAPKSERGLRIDYPELRNYKEFDIRPKELLFVWYYACKSSPYFNLDIPEKEIVKKCIEASGLYFSDPVKKTEFLEGRFPDKIKLAVQTMNSFEPSARIKAKLDAARNYSNYMKLTKLELDEDGNNVQFLNKDNEIDFNKKAKYQGMLEDSIEHSIKLVSIIEASNSLTERSKTNIEDKNMDADGRSFGDSFHDEN